MKSKKRQKPVQEEPKPQSDKLQADHELFLQAFEKPTQIYRYLRSRNLLSPIFLHRNLYYMKHRCSRQANTREGFKVDDILAKVESKYKKEYQIASYKSEYMNLTFTAFIDKDNHTTETVDVEPILMKICHKKRKDVSSPVLKISLGHVTVPCNPETASPSKAEAIAVGSNNFSHSNGHTVRSYMLMVNVTCHQKIPISTVNHSLCNGDASETELLVPAAKRRRNSRASGEEDEYLERKVVYGAELVVYDKHKRCLLTEGDYEVALQDLTTKVPSKKQATWETVMDGKAVGPFEVFNKCPTLKFKLNWNQQPIQGIVENWELLTPAPEPPVKNHNNHINNHCMEKAVVRRESQTPKKKETTAPKRRRIFYQFLYNNNTRQQTEARDDCHCPWCSLACSHLFSLLKHLRTSHPRFNFTYVEHPKGARIDVCISDCYDGSYVGNPQDLHSHIGFAFSRTGPVRRTPVTHLIVYKPKKTNTEDLSEFMEPEAEPHTERQFIQGHNRLYFHTKTQVPIRPQEIDQDSEAETDPQWLREKTQNLIDEFTDVNEGEKEVMKMWNLHIMHYNYIGDCQLSRALQAFVEEYGPEVIKKNLCRNLLLHLVNLYDFSLIKSDLVFRTMVQLHRLRDQIENDGLVPAGPAASAISTATSSHSGIQNSQGSGGHLSQSQHGPTTNGLPSIGQL